MTRIALLAALFAMATALGCSSKAKKQETTPTKTATGDVKKPQPEIEEQPVKDDGDAKDPANLGEVIYFEFDSSDLDDKARATLNENAEWLKEDPKRTLTIEGHTDETGTTEYNVGLGERRARATRDYLVRLGIDEKRISIISYGEERPVSDEDSLNRRSVFVATKK